MTTALITHEDCLEHDAHEGHPECPDRLRSILKALSSSDFSDLLRLDAPLATREEIALAHPRAHVDQVLDRMNASDHVQFDPDTGTSAGTHDAVLRAAGAILLGIDQVMQGAVANAFCATRPPGHHAEAEKVMGFCFFNNAAIGAYYLREKYALKKIAVVDFDVHHGNGTQAIFWDDPDLFYGSTHQGYFYPGTGAADEVGQGNIVNAPLPAGAGSISFRSAIEDIILPALDAFVPEFLIISAGFDAHKDDPLAQLELDEDDFAWVISELLKIAHTHCGGKTVSILEGGYNLDALGSSVAAHVKAMMEV